MSYWFCILYFLLFIIYVLDFVMIPNKTYIYYRNQVILNSSSFQNLFSIRTACHMIPVSSSLFVWLKRETI